MSFSHLVLFPGDKMRYEREAAHRVTVRDQLIKYLLSFASNS